MEHFDRTFAAGLGRVGLELQQQQQQMQASAGCGGAAVAAAAGAAAAAAAHRSDRVAAGVVDHSHCHHYSTGGSSAGTGLRGRYGISTPHSPNNHSH